MRTQTLLPGRKDLTPAPVLDCPHVVIVGAGFAGLACAQALGGKRVRVTIVDRNNYHLFVPLLYQVATAALSPADIAEPIRKALRRHDNVDVVMGEVSGIDIEDRRVLVGSEGYIPYDRLVVATGSVYNYFGNEEWASVAPGLKTVDDARRIRASVLRGLERAELTKEPREQQANMTSIIVGGGATGVEMAGAIAELTRCSLHRDFRNIDPTAATTILVEAGERILAPFPEELARYAHRRLEKIGVSVRTQSPVEEIGRGTVTVAGEVIPACTIVWAAGVRASPAASWLGLEPDRLGRVPVNARLAVEGCPGVFAIGDTAAAADEAGRPLPGLAQVAKQQGAYLGQALAAELERGAALPPFRFRNRGNAAVVGRSAALFDFGRHRLKGWFAWVLWALVHIYLLVGFEKRLLVSLQWFWQWLTYQSGVRIITDEEGRRTDAVDRADPGKDRDGTAPQ